METPLQTATRLLAALEELTEQESVLMRNLRFADVTAVQKRAGPLVEQLSALAAYPEVVALRPQVAGLLQRRQESRLFLEERLALVRSELQRINDARARLAKVVPAYVGVARGGESKLNSAA